MIELRLLGGVDLQIEGRERDSSGLLGRPKRLALLSYLASARPNGLHSRDQLIALFWPEADQEHARAALRKTVHLLRTDLGDSVITTVGDDQLGCNGAIWCDVAEFDKAFRASEFAATSTAAIFSQASSSPTRRASSVGWRRSEPRSDPVRPRPLAAAPPLLTHGRSTNRFATPDSHSIMPLMTRRRSGH
jgi:hypothetical protein